MQYRTYSLWVHLRRSQLSLSKFRTHGDSQSWSCSPCCIPTRNTVTPSSDFSDLYNSTVQCGPPLLVQHSRSTLIFKPLITFLPILYLFPLPPHHRPLLLAVLLRLLIPFSLIPSGFFNGMLEVFEPGALNCYTFFRPTPSTLSVSRNPILTHLSLSGFLNSLLCVLIASTPGLAFSLVMPRTLAAASSFSSGRAYFSLNFLPPLSISLRLIPTLII